MEECTHSTARNVDTVSVSEVLDGSTDGRLELNNGLSLIRDLVVDDDLEVHAIIVHHALDSTEVDPQAAISTSVPPIDDDNGTHLLVLKILNVRMDLKSSIWSEGT